MTAHIATLVSAPIVSSDAKLLAAVVDSVRCAFMKHSDNPEALRHAIGEILSEDGIGQSVADVINAAA